MAYSATFNLNPNRSQHEEDVYYVRVFPTGRRPTPTPTPTATPGHTYCHRKSTHADTYAYFHANSYCNAYGNSNTYRYSDGNAQAHAYAEICSQHQGRAPRHAPGRDLVCSYDALSAVLGMRLRLDRARRLQQRSPNACAVRNFRRQFRHHQSDIILDKVAVLD